jgi:hypothetical protein
MKKNLWMLLAISFSANSFDLIKWDDLPGGSPRIPKSKSDVIKVKPQPDVKPSCIIQVKSTITVSSNKVLDGKGCLYTWRGAGYPDKCQASAELSEKEPPMFVLKPGATLRNLHMECALDGIHTSSNNKIQNVVNRDVEEDAITIGTNILIENSEFWFCQDKCLQMNRADGVIIRNNKFFHANSPMKANTGKNVQVYNNYFYNVNKAVRAEQSISKIIARENVVKRAKCYLSAEGKATITDEGGAELSSVEKAHCTLNGGKIIK